MEPVNPYLVKTVIGDAELSIKADPGESFMVKDIMIYSPAANYLTLMIDRTTVGYFRVGGVLGSHLPFIPGRSAPALPTHEHISLKMTAADTLTAISATDVSQEIKNGKGAAIDLMGVRIGASGTTVKTADIATSTDVVLGGQVPQVEQKTLLSLMIGRGIMNGYPVAVGETFKLSGVKGANCIQLVIYEQYLEEEIKSEMANGSKSKEYVFLNYGNAGADISTVTSTEYGTSKNPAEFPDFPFGKVVPAKTRIELLDILASDFAPEDNDGSNQIWTTYVQLIAERVTLFDEDRNGLLLLGPSGTNVGARVRVGEGQSLIGNYSDVDARLPLEIPGGLKYAAGDELQVYLSTGGAGTPKQISITEGEIAFVEKVTREE